MSVLVTTRVPDLPGDVYEQIAAQLAEPLRAADGFIAHAASINRDGVTVTELWDTRTDWQRFFAANVEPNLPAGLPAPTVREVHNTIVA